MNLVVFHGNLGRDPESRVLNSGDTVTSFSLAVKGRRKDDGPMWVRVSVWGKQGDTCKSFLHKGSGVIVYGNLSYDLETGGPRIWESNSGPRSSFDMVASRVEFVGGRVSASEAPVDNPVEEEEDSIPF